MSKIQNKKILHKNIILFLCISCVFSWKTTFTNEIYGRRLEEDNDSKFLTKRNEIKNQTATEFAIALLKLPQFEPEERPNIPALQKSYMKEKSESEEEISEFPKIEKSEDEKKSEKEKNETKKPKELNNPSVDDIMNSNPMFQKKFGLNNNMENLLNSNPMFHKSSGQNNNIQSELQKNPMFKKSNQNSKAEDYIKNNPLFKMNKNQEVNSHQESIEQRISDMKKRREMQLQETLEERERLKKDPNAKPRPSKLKQQEQMKELYSVYNEFLKNDPSINDNNDLEPENLFELYQKYLQEEIMKKSSYKKHMKDAADFFGYEELAKEYEEKPKKDKVEGEVKGEKGQDEVQEEIESLIDLAKGKGNASEDSEESFESLIN